LYDFVSLFYPRVCPSCGYPLFRNEKVICSRCLFRLPRTKFHLQESNPVSELFWGRVPVSYGTAMFWYRKGSRVQKLIHRFKYQGMKEIGVFLGEMYGHELKANPFISGCELIVPVPLHPRKLRLRGFNQSEVIAGAMAQPLGIPVVGDLLVRKGASETQTRKSRFKRWENVSGIFDLNKPERITGKQVMLVDDVVTTGSTLEACARTLLSVEGVRVGVAALGFSAR
jgi:ComF family protein